MPRAISSWRPSQRRVRRGGFSAEPFSTEAPHSRGFVAKPGRMGDPMGLDLVIENPRADPQESRALLLNPIRSGQGIRDRRFFDLVTFLPLPTHFEVLLLRDPEQRAS